MIKIQQQPALTQNRLKKSVEQNLRILTLTVITIQADVEQLGKKPNKSYAQQTMLPVALEKDFETDSVKDCETNWAAEQWWILLE